MNVGIILFSRTGNTLSVAEKIKEACEAQGHTAVIDEIKIENADTHSKSPLKFTRLPDPVPYDALIFASAVEAFSLSSVMKAYLSQMPSVSGKKTYAFVTQQLKHKWMGGNNAIKQMCGLCGAKGLQTAETGIVNWSSPKKEEQIKEIAGRFGNI